MDVELVKTLLFFLSGGFLVFLAVTVARDNFANRLNRAVGALLFFAGLGPIVMALRYILQQPLANPTGLSTSGMYNLHLLWELVFPALLVFSWYFPVDRIREFKHPRLRYLIFLPQIVHVILAVFFANIDAMLDSLARMQEQEGFLNLIMQPFIYVFQLLLLFIDFVLEYQDIVFGSINLMYVMIAAYFLETGRRLLANPRLLPQTISVLWAVRLGMGIYVALFLTGIMFPGFLNDTLQSWGFLAAVLAGTTFFTIAIVRHQFLDVRFVFRHSLIYTLSSAVLVGLYIVIGFQAMEMLEPIFGDRAELVSYGLIVVLLLFFQPISSWIDNGIRSMFMSTRSDHRNIIERFSREVISIFDPNQLRQTIEETMKTALLVERVYFCLYDDSIEEYAILPSDDYERRTIIRRDDLMLRGINLLDKPTLFESLNDYSAGSNLAPILKDLRVRLILPMKDTEHLLGFLALTGKVAGYRYSPEDFNLLGVLSNQMVTALTNARLYVDSLERIRLEEEVTMARQIQLDLLPSKPPQIDCGVIFAHSTPSRTVGGDYYDFVPVDARQCLGIVIADASGKGMPAALMIAQIQAIIRSEVYNGNSIATMLRNMNRQIAASTSSEKYVTLFYGEVEQKSGLFSYANAGHNYPILVRKGGDVELLKIGGPVIGAFPFLDYESTSVTLNSDDLLFLFTDGLSEAMDAQGNEYTEDRVRDFLVEHRTLSAQEIVDAILDDVRKFDPSTPPQDDTTIVAMKMTAHGMDSHVGQITGQN